MKLRDQAQCQDCGSTITQIVSRDYNLVLCLMWVSRSGRMNQINLALFSGAANLHLSCSFTLKDIIKRLSPPAPSPTRFSVDEGATDR